MVWYKSLYEFWLSNLEQNIKKISIGFGSLLIVILTSFTLPLELFLSSLYGAGISFGSMAIMSVFGKNGNSEFIISPSEKVPKSIPEPVKPKLIPENPVIPKEPIRLP